MTNTISDGAYVVLSNGSLGRLSGVDSSSAYVYGPHGDGCRWSAGHLATLRSATEDERRQFDAAALAHRASLARHIEAGERLVRALDDGQRSADSDC